MVHLVQSVWPWGYQIDGYRQDFLDLLHRNDRELVAHSSLLIPLDTWALVKFQPANAIRHVRHFRRPLLQRQ